MERYFLIAVFCLLTTGSISADEQSMTAYELAETRLLAEWVGLPDEQFTLGTVYYKGKDAPQDYNEALKWYRKAAEQGHANSQYQLGVMYEKGEGVPQDYTQAAKWYGKAAEQGHVNSRHQLSVMYDKGEGVPQDYTEAVEWYRKMARQGLASAQYNLGKKYADGLGVPQNFAQAYVWFSLSAASGYEDAMDKRDVYAGKLSREEISLAQQRSAVLFEEIQQRKTQQAKDTAQ